MNLSKNVRKLQFDSSKLEFKTFTFLEQQQFVRSLVKGVEIR